MTPSNRCQHGRLLSTSKARGPQGCPERAVEGRFYCQTHEDERWEKLRAWIAEHGEPKPRPWSASYMVSGSSRE